MHKLTYKEHDNLISALNLLYYRIILDDLCSDGREIYYSWISFVEDELYPLLDDNFQIEIEGLGICDFRYRSKRYNDETVYDFADLDCMGIIQGDK